MLFLDLQENIIEGHTHYSPPVNYYKERLDGYADEDLDSEDMEFSETPYGMKKT